MSGVAIVLLLLLAATALAVLAGWRAVSPNRLLAYLMLALGGLFSVCMLAVTLALSFQVWQDVQAATRPASAVMPTQAPASAAASSAAAPTRETVDGSGAIANAMTAIGTVVAVVALILSLGTSWFANVLQQAQRTTELLREGEARRQQEREREREWARLVQRTDEGLLLAKAALIRWVDQVGTSDPVNLVQNWALQLEMLRAEDSGIRWRAFEALQVLGPECPTDRVDPLLAPVADYTERCHELALWRLSEGADGQPADPRAVAAAVEQGLWCRLFDAVELARYQRELAR